MKFLTITISVSDGQIYHYKQLPSNTKIGDPTKTGRYCEVCQHYCPLTNITRPCIRIIYIIYITYLVKLYLVLSVPLQFPDLKTHSFAVKFLRMIPRLYRMFLCGLCKWCNIHLMEQWGQQKRKNEMKFL